MAFAFVVCINACAIACIDKKSYNELPFNPALNINRIVRPKRVLDEVVLRLSEIDRHRVDFCRLVNLSGVNSIYLTIDDC